MATTGNKNSPTNSHPQEQESPPQPSSSSSPASSSSHPKPGTMSSSPTSAASNLASPPQPRLATTTITARHNSSSSCSSIDDIAPGSWKSPVHIDDADLTFDGKPLNLLHEENQSRWVLEQSEAAGESTRGRRREVDYSRRKGDNHDAHAARTNKT